MLLANSHFGFKISNLRWYYSWCVSMLPGIGTDNLVDDEWISRDCSKHFLIQVQYPVCALAKEIARHVKYNVYGDTHMSAS